MNTQSHESTAELLDGRPVVAIMGKRDGANNSAPSDTFFCDHGQHWVERTQACYPRAENPSICKSCAAERRAARKVYQQRRKTLAGEIPAEEMRGGIKRATFSVSRFTLTALDVLAVGSSASEIVEQAIMAYLRSQDADVIAFVGKIFEQLETK